MGMVTIEEDPGRRKKGLEKSPKVFDSMMSRQAA